jgi:hypothetical protein
MERVHDRLQCLNWESGSYAASNTFHEVRIENARGMSSFGTNLDTSRILLFMPDIDLISALISTTRDSNLIGSPSWNDWISSASSESLASGLEIAREIDDRRYEEGKDEQGMRL